MNTQDVAVLLGKTTNAVYLAVYRGSIPVRRLGRRIVSLPDELERFLRRLPHVEAAREKASDKRQGPSRTRG